MEYIFEEQGMMDSVTDINGNEWMPSQVACYNDYTRRINAFAGRPMKSDSEAFTHREALLDRRHAFYVTIAALQNL